MKATGIVRRIDDLGRVVIPKEIRRTMKIREGDPLEIYTSSDGEVIFKKYSPMGEMSALAADCASALAAVSDTAVLIFDRDRCIAAGGRAKKDLVEKPITHELEQVNAERKIYTNKSGVSIGAAENCECKIMVAVPIISESGDIAGTVVLIEREPGKAADDTDIKIAEVAAKFLSERIE